MRELPSIEQRLKDAGWEKDNIGTWHHIDDEGDGVINRPVQRAANMLDVMPLLTEIQSRHDEAEAEVLSMQVQLGELRKERDRIDNASIVHEKASIKLSGYLATIADRCGLPGDVKYADIPAMIAEREVSRCKDCDDRPAERDNLKLRNTIEALEGVLVSMGRVQPTSSGWENMTVNGVPISELIAREKRPPLHCGWCGALIPKHGPRTCTCMDGKNHAESPADGRNRFDALEAAVKEQAERMDRHCENEDDAFTKLFQRVEKAESNITRANEEIRGGIRSHGELCIRVDMLEKVHNGLVDELGSHVDPSKIKIR